MKKSRQTGLQSLPGVGPSIAADLRQLGFHTVDSLRNQNPEEMYARLCRMQARHLDRCLLYVFRCAVYAASTAEPDARLLLWWNWKDR